MGQLGTKVRGAVAGSQPWCCHHTGSARNSCWGWQAALPAHPDCQIDSLLNSRLLPALQSLLEVCEGRGPGEMELHVHTMPARGTAGELPLLAAFPACQLHAHILLLSSKMCVPFCPPRHRHVGRRKPAGQALLIFNALRHCHFLPPSPGSCRHRSPLPHGRDHGSLSCLTCSQLSWQTPRSWAN